MTQQLLELHGGWIEVESTVGVGSVFTAWVPAQLLPAAPLAFVSAGNTQGQIVLIAHQEETAKIICDLLTTAGYQVIWIMDGLSAVAQVQLLQPQLVILEMQLSGADGTEVILQLRRTPLAKPLKILSLSPPDGCTHPCHPLTVGADDYMSYPFQPQELFHKIVALLALVNP